MALLLLQSPTDYSTLFTALCLIQDIPVNGTGSEREAVITHDVDLHEQRIKLKTCLGESNWTLCPEELDYCFAAMHIFGKLCHLIQNLFHRITPANILQYI